jgi:hypothetical protein
MGANLTFALGDNVRINYSAFKSKTDRATLQTTVEYDKTNTQSVDLMTYLASNNLFKPDKKLFDFPVKEHFLKKSLELTFKSTDGLSTIKKQIKI